MLHELSTETTIEEYFDFDQDVEVSEGIVTQKRSITERKFERNA